MAEVLINASCQIYQPETSHHICRLADVGQNHIRVMAPIKNRGWEPVGSGSVSVIYTYFAWLQRVHWYLSEANWTKSDFDLGLLLQKKKKRTEKKLSIHAKPANQQACRKTYDLVLNWCCDKQVIYSRRKILGGDLCGLPIKHYYKDGGDLNIVTGKNRRFTVSVYSVMLTSAYNRSWELQLLDSKAINPRIYSTH